MESKRFDALVAVRLLPMMFLQFFVWGAWYVTAYPKLVSIGFLSGEMAWVYSVGPLAGMISPFFLGMIADRFFATERVLACLHLAGAGFMYLAIREIDANHPDPGAIILALFGHMLCYMPTLSLSNSLALHNMTDARWQFPLIRVLGTVGWIVAGLTLSFAGWDKKTEMFSLAMWAGVGLAVYSLTLPHTPPPKKGEPFSAREAIGLDALVLLKQPSYLVFMVGSFLTCIPLTFYYQLAGRYVEQAGIADVAWKMSWGQIAEIFFMLAMPLFFARLGVKKMLLIGILAWVARYALFSFGAPADGAKGIVPMIILGIVLHGICYDFFFVTGQIYTDRVAPARIRSQAQGMLVLFTLGLGMFIGAQVAGFVDGMYTPESARAMGAEADGLGEQYKELRTQVAGMNEAAAAPVKAEMAQLKEKIDGLQKSADAVMRDWAAIWLVPAIGAGIVLLLFGLFFRDRAGEVGSDPDPGAD